MKGREESGGLIESEIGGDGRLGTGVVIGTKS